MPNPCEVIYNGKSYSESDFKKLIMSGEFDDAIFGGKNNGGAGAPTMPQPAEASFGDPDMTKMANAINDAHVEGKLGVKTLDEIMGKLEDTDVKDIYEKVKRLASLPDTDPNKLNLDKVRERLLITKQGNEFDQAALLYDLVQLKEKERNIQNEIVKAATDPQRVKQLQDELIDVKNKMYDNALANSNMGRSASTVFRLRQLWANKEGNLSDFKNEYMASKGLSSLTKEQEKVVTDAYNKIRESKTKVEDAKAAMQKEVEKNEALKHEMEQLEKMKQQAQKQKKEDRDKKTEERIQKSNERIQKAKDRLKALRAGMNDVTRVVPETAAAISQIAAEKVYQGVVKFADVVREVYDEIRDVFPEWSEKDVRNHLLPKLSSDVIDRYYENIDGVMNSDKELKEKVESYRAAQKEYAVQMYKWQRDRRSDMMENKPVGARIIDWVLRWQRFAVLSYPTTLIKLGAVVGYQVLFKPFKFAAQALIHEATKIISPELAKKQGIFGAPKIASLSKFYASFVRNFALQNLKEHFAGVDTNEILYGRGGHYDEFSAAKGLLDMPGRSHGYIKSFIKNPEFQFAHNQLVSNAISMMSEFEQKLADPHISPEERDRLKSLQEGYDVTKEEVMEGINKLSLEHAKWSILMNDNRFTEKFRRWAESSDVWGALVKSELPIVKVPINYVGRVFAMKYGLVRAVSGKGGWEGGDHFPGIVEMIVKGTKDIDQRQADMFSRTLNIGSIGAAFFLLGYLNKDDIKANEDGSYDIMGKHISKYLIHVPEYESMFSGAETARDFNHGKKQDAMKWMEAMLQSDYDIAKKNPFASMLKYGFIPNVAAALMSDDSRDKATTKILDAVAKKVTDMTVPGMVKQPAQWLDTKEEGVHPGLDPIKRSPQGSNLERMWQRFELAIPGLRSNVPKSRPHR